VAFIVIMLVMLGFMYLLLIRPQRAQQRRHRELLGNLKPGDEIITAGGIYGDVVGVEDEKVHVQIAEDVEIEVARRSIASIVPPEVGQSPEGVGAEELEAGRPALEAGSETGADGGAEALDQAELEEAGRTRGAQPRRQE
jgi:preprotein translocase subunit YajC